MESAMDYYLNVRLLFLRVYLEAFNLFVLKVLPRKLNNYLITTNT